jgi:hypothetical protein
MPEPYGPEPAPGPITLELFSLARVERQRRRARALKELEPGDSFTLNGYQVQLLAPVDFTRDGLGVELKLRARVVATGELLPMDRAYRFINPPLLRWNGTYRTTERGDVQNFEEGPMEAFKRDVLAAVLWRARRYGWNG